MYREFFKLEQQPFRQVDGGDAIYLSTGHDTARSYIEYLLRDSDGLGLILGDAGSGKTATLHHVLQKNGETVIAACLSQPELAPTELLLAVCMQLGIETKNIAADELAHAIEQFGLRQHLHGKVVTIIVDDAHRLSRDVLIQLRTLAKPDRHGFSKINLLFVGRPQLGEVIESTNEEFPRQQIRFTYRLNPLLENEVGSYIQHRVAHAGENSKLAFGADVNSLIYRYTGGVPALINILGSKVLDETFARQKSEPDVECVNKVIEDLGWELFVDSSDAEERAAAGGSPHLPPVGAKLIVRSKGTIIAEHLLKKQRVLLGRQSDKDIFIHDKRVSRSHAQLVRINDVFFLQDLDSSNGTFLGKKKIKWHSLRSGDVFRIGGHEIEYVEHQTPLPDSPATAN